MKIKILSILALVSLSLAQGQQITDGLRYATDKNMGSARYTALGGAMGALGGDLSAMASNPAGGAVFVTSNFTFSAGLHDYTNKTKYFNNNEKGYYTSLDLNQIGGVFVFDNPEEKSSFQKFTIGVNYQTNNNYDNEVFVAGRANASIGNFFLAQAQGIPLDLLQTQSGESISDLYAYLGETHGSAAQNAFLGYQGYLFDPVDPDNAANTNYILNVTGNGFNQEHLLRTKGYNSKFTFNFATQIENNYYVGLNLNTHIIDYDESKFYSETNNNTGSSITAIGFEDNLSVEGAGFSLQLGGIAKIADNIRVGINWDTPTWYRISESTAQYLETRRIEDSQTLTTVVDPRVINVYADYDLRTPGKIGVNAAYIFDQHGLISFDYSYKDYSNMKYRPTNDSYFQELNSAIKDNLKATSTFKAGAEYRFNQLSLRGGFQFEESPYKEKKIIGDTTGFSLGTGYNFGGWTIDLAYAHLQQDQVMQLMPVGFTEKANVKRVDNNFILSLGFSF